MLGFWLNNLPKFFHYCQLQNFCSLNSVKSTIISPNYSAFKSGECVKDSNKDKHLRIISKRKKLSYYPIHHLGSIPNVHITSLKYINWEDKQPKFVTVHHVYYDCSYLLIKMTVLFSGSRIHLGDTKNKTICSVYQRRWPQHGIWAVQVKNFCQMHNQTPKGKFPKSFSLIHPAVQEKLWSQDLVTTYGRTGVNCRLAFILSLCLK